MSRVAIAIAAAAAIGVAFVQPHLASESKVVKQRDDAFALPPPDQLRVMTLGYKNAAADLLWAKLIVEWGMHHQEKRPFPDVTRFIDGILAVEPDFPPLYEFVDTLLMYGPTLATEEDARTTRRYLEYGTKVRPYDHEIWLHYGQFLAFLAPTFLKDKAEIERWRSDGAFALMRAVELGSDPDRSLAAYSILKNSRDKTRKALLAHYERAYALTDDPDTRRNLLFKMKQLEDAPHGEEAVDIVERDWRAHYGFLSRSAALLVGPSRDPAACAGPSSWDEKRCPRDWSMAIRAAQ